MLCRIALVSETAMVPTARVNQVAAAISTQVLRDVAPVWGLNTTVDAFESLDQIPPDYWKVVLRDDIDEPGLVGVHKTVSGQPIGLVQFHSEWPLVASHEVLEMLVNPYGERVVRGRSPHPDQEDADFLLEICDPCRSINHAYEVDGFMLSDFCLPAYFGMEHGGDRRLSYMNHIRKPFQLLRGGYLMWIAPDTGMGWMKHWFGNAHEFSSLGAVLDRPSDLRRGLDAELQPRTLVEGTRRDSAALRRSQKAARTQEARSRREGHRVSREIDRILAH